ncbi:MATE family efflux transporter [Psychromonas marina]|uniref:Multidrug export protein MepA n=1 Tax=Psychromonas marina TaxID=88364 RepID=A0ABQ6DW29_9GAMM|nr:MATE family efflux transporter [Psychromonas marina]GLS89305.1 MATE family efflux transporter [Psychromonas marina]
MNTIESQNNNALDGPIISTFLKYLLPSTVGMLAMSSASIVDGIFIGNFVGVEALAAVNLIIPLLSVLFGVGLMLAIGGSVRAGKFLGQKKQNAASAIFSKTLIATIVYAIAIIAIGLLLEPILFRLLGAGEILAPLMSEYYRVVLPFFVAQLSTIVLYFFIRLDGFPTLASTALVIGAVLNIALDYLFIAVFDWGLSGAAWATGLSQLLPLLTLLAYFFKKKRKLHFSIKQNNWSEIFHAAYNGLSEFINEISAGIIALIFNLLLISRAGIEGVAAITVLNYLLMLGFMVYFSIADTAQVMISQNFGARNVARTKQLLATTLLVTSVVSVIAILILLCFNESLITMFLDDQGTEKTATMAIEFVYYMWPIFIFAGVNMAISGYLTAIHLPFQSGVVSICRSLIFPATLLITLFMLFDDNRFVIALPIGECLTFLIALAYFIRHKPERAIAEDHVKNG